MTHIHFPNTDDDSVVVDPKDPLSTQLTLQNSPILFGCRTGICGTCLVAATGDMDSPSAEEQEVLTLFAADCLNARLACQIKPTGDISQTPLKP